MKLVVLIPAYNEEQTIQKLIMEIPRKIYGVDKVEVLVVDDGSSDRTVELALNAGADKIVYHKKNLGVGAAFMTGIRNAITMEADIVVNLDADLQFDPKQIPELILPIITKQYEVVIGSRFLRKNNTFNYPKIKVFGNKVFTKLISCITQQKLTDTQTGFRAYSKEALLDIAVVNEFSYTQEVLIDLCMKGFKVDEIPVSVRYDNKRKSRVVKNIVTYTINSLIVIMRCVIFHRPVFSLGLLGFMLLIIGVYAKVITISNIFSVSSLLSSGLILLGIVSFMLAIICNVFTKRFAFAEKDIRHYLKENSNGTNY